MRITTKPRSEGAESSAPPVNGASVPLIPAAPLAMAPVKRRRPATLIAATIVLLIAGGLGSVWAVNSSGQRTAVVGVATTVQWGEVITASDLAQVDVVPDANLRPVLWSNRTQLIGQRAATELLPGSLVTSSSVMSDSIPGPGQALVGVSVKAAQSPLEGFSPQSNVQLVVAPASSATGATGAAPTVYAGTVVTASKADASGSRIVDVLVDSKDAAAVAVAASAGNVTLVAIPRG